MTKFEREEERIHARQLAMERGFVDELRAFVKSVKFNEQKSDPRLAPWWGRVIDQGKGDSR